MNILTFFTQEGTPKTGLTPLIKITNINMTILYNWVAMDELTDGWYKFNFSNYDYTQEYIVIMDGGEDLIGSERWNSAFSDNAKDDIGKIVWNAQKTDFNMANSFGELLNTAHNDLKRTLGLLHENIYIDNPIYDDAHNLVNARVRIYSDPASLGTDNDVIGSYLISSNGDGLGKFTYWSQIKL